jgi:hypothetical protein
MQCPACHKDVDEGADLCLECGEPIGDSPAAKVARADASGPIAVPTPSPPPTQRPSVPRPPAHKTIPGVPSAIRGGRPKVPEDPEAIRCPGCGVKTTSRRCPSCGAVLRSDEG